MSPGFLHEGGCHARITAQLAGTGHRVCECQGIRGHALQDQHAEQRKGVHVSW
jgi:hypothetical protein